MLELVVYPLSALGAWVLGKRAYRRIQLSRAKHRSLGGHARIALRLSRVLPNYEYGDDEFFRVDDAPPEVADRRRAGFERLALRLEQRAPRTLAASAALANSVSDVAFTNAYRVPFQFRRLVQERLRVGILLERTEGMRVQDLDGNWSYDLGGSYGMNLLGYDFYKHCIERAVERVGALGPILGSYHPLLADNVDRLREISGQDEVSFHMSGTEAVMQAVRLARYHTGRSHVVRFCGAYHGWWDGVQTGPGNPLPVRDVHTLADMSERSLEVLRTRTDIACVLINTLQSMHPNSSAPSDGTLIASDRKARHDRAAYTAWLAQVRAVCTERRIALVIDDVFMGFRLALGGSQEYYGVRADLVTYGKTVGGGLPIGVVCGRKEWMRRFRDDRPSDICFARGTFNSHPYVMAAMNEFLRHIVKPEVSAQYADIDQHWDGRCAALNATLVEHDLPVRLANLTSVFTTLYIEPGRYNWMFQYYLRAEGLSMSWIGTGRFIFTHACSDEDFREIARRFVAAAEAMRADGWWSTPATLSNKAIKRRVLGEVVRASLHRSSGRSVPRAASAAASASKA
jgi:glutamate-1-semialdehyde 2,1-aminomutase